MKHAEDVRREVKSSQNTPPIREQTSLESQPPNRESNILYSGFLEKKSSGCLARWHRRHFRLHEPDSQNAFMLTYASAEYSVETFRKQIKVPHRERSQNDIPSGMGVTKIQGVLIPTIKLQLPNGNLLLRCEDPREIERWFSAFQAALGAQRKFSAQSNKIGDLDLKNTEKADTQVEEFLNDKEIRTFTFMGTSSNGEAGDEKEKELDYSRLTRQKSRIPNESSSQVTAEIGILSPKRALQPTLEIDEPSLSMAGWKIQSNGNGTVGVIKSTQDQEQPRVQNGKDNASTYHRAEGGKFVHNNEAADDWSANDPNTSSLVAVERPTYESSVVFPNVENLPNENSFRAHSGTVMKNIYLTSQTSDEASNRRTDAFQQQFGSSSSVIHIVDFTSGATTPRRLQKPAARVVSGAGAGSYGAISPRGSQGGQTPRDTPRLMPALTPRASQGALTPRDSAPSSRIILPVPVLRAELIQNREREEAQEIVTPRGTSFFRAATKISPRHYKSFLARKFLQPDCDAGEAPLNFEGPVPPHNHADEPSGLYRLSL